MHGMYVKTINCLHFEN